MSVSPLEPPAVRVGLRDPAGPYRRGWQEVEVKHSPRYVRDFEELARVVRREAEASFTPEHDLAVHEALLAASGME